MTRARPVARTKGKQETTLKVAMKNDESDDKDAEIMRLIERKEKIAPKKKNTD